MHVLTLLFQSGSATVSCLVLLTLGDSQGGRAGLVRDNFDRTVIGQINFDAILLKELGGFGKVNILAVTLVREDEDHIL